MEWARSHIVLWLCVIVVSLAAPDLHDAPAGAEEVSMVEPAFDSSPMPYFGKTGSAEIDSAEELIEQAEESGKQCSFQQGSLPFSSMPAVPAQLGYTLIKNRHCKYKGMSLHYKLQIRKKGLPSEKFLHKMLTTAGAKTEYAMSVEYKSKTKVEACTPIGTGFEIWKGVMKMKNPKMCVVIPQMLIKAGMAVGTAKHLKEKMQDADVRGKIQRGIRGAKDKFKKAKQQGSGFLNEMTGKLKGDNQLGESASTDVHETALVLAEETEGVVMKKELQLRVSAELEVKLKGEKSLQFHASLAVEPSRLVVKANMKGLWCNPFGLKDVCIGNFNLGLALSATPSYVAFGGLLGFGSGCKGGMTSDVQGGLKTVRKCTQAAVYVGVDALKPANSYFSVNFQRLALDEIVSWLAPWTDGTPIIKVLKNIEFPKGLQMSFSKAKVKFAAFTIPQGLLIAGEIRAFGYGGSVLLKSNSQTPLLFRAQCTPVKIGSVLRLTRNLEDDVNGPLLFVEVKKAPASLTLRYEGAVTVLGISAAVVVNVSPSGALFRIEGQLAGGVLKAKVEVSLPSPSNFKSGQAGTFKAMLQVGALTKNLKSGINKVINKAKKLVKKLKEIHDKVRKIASKVGISFGTLEEETQLVYERDEAALREREMGEGFGGRRRRRRSIPWWKKAAMAAKRAANAVADKAKAAARAVKEKAIKVKNFALKQFYKWKKKFEDAARAAKGLGRLIKAVHKHGLGYVFQVCNANMAGTLSTSNLGGKVGIGLLINGKRVHLGMSIHFTDIMRTLRENAGMLKDALFNTFSGMTSRGQEKCEGDAEKAFVVPVSKYAKTYEKSAKLPNPDVLKALQDQASNPPKTKWGLSKIRRRKMKQKVKKMQKKIDHAEDKKEAKGEAPGFSSSSSNTNSNANNNVRQMTSDMQAIAQAARSVSPNSLSAAAKAKLNSVVKASGSNVRQMTNDMHSMSHAARSVSPDSLSAAARNAISAASKLDTIARNSDQYSSGSKAAFKSCVFKALKDAKMCDRELN